MKKILLLLIVVTILYTDCNKDVDKGGAVLTQHQLDSLAILADTMYIRNEVIDTSRITIINSKKVYMYSCDMYFPKQLGTISMLQNHAIIEYKLNPNESYYSGQSIFTYKTMDFSTGRIFVQVGVDTAMRKYHWQFQNGGTYINTLDRSFKL